MNIPLLVQRIILGKLLFVYNNKEYCYIQPDNSLKYKAELLYNKIIEDNLYEPWTRMEELPRLLKFLDLWNNDDQVLLDQNMKKIDTLKLSLYNNRLNTKKTSDTRKTLRDTQDNIQRLMSKKNTLDYLTLEEYANIKKSEYLFLHSIFDSSNNLYFSTEPSLVAHSEFDNVINEISKYFISVEEYKQIARSDHWKGIWNGNKYNVFDRAGSSLTDEQKSLINISVMYDRIYEHPECPDDSVIKDDDMLDGWMIYQRQKIENSKKEANAQNIADKHGNAREIFVVSDREDVDNIYSMNSIESKNIIRQRTRAITSSDAGIDEVNLPDVQRDLLQKVNTAAKR